MDCKSNNDGDKTDNAATSVREDQGKAGGAIGMVILIPWSFAVLRQTVQSRFLKLCQRPEHID